MPPAIDDRSPRAPPGLGISSSLAKETEQWLYQELDIPFSPQIASGSASPSAYGSPAKSPVADIIDPFRKQSTDANQRGERASPPQSSPTTPTKYPPRKASLHNLRPMDSSTAPPPPPPLPMGKRQMRGDTTPDGGSPKMREPASVDSTPQKDTSRSRSSSQNSPESIRRPENRKNSPNLSSTMTRSRGMTTNSAHQPTLPPLRFSTSIPDFASLRSSNRGLNSIYRPDRGPYARDSTRSSITREQLPSSGLSEEIRSSFRSNWTIASSNFLDPSDTERSSVVTKASSFSDLDMLNRAHATKGERTMSVEDTISLYSHGFEDDPTPAPTIEGKLADATAEADSKPPVPPILRRASVENEKVDRETGQSPKQDDQLLPPAPQIQHARSSTQMFVHASHKNDDDQKPQPSALPQPPALPPLPKFPYAPLREPRPKPEDIPRDRYGFKKASQYVSVDEYDGWNVGYEEYLARRRKKWMGYMKQYGLSTEKPIRFPLRSDKAKRYIRKGIPPDWRGAAWFWYAGGPSRLAQAPGLYWDLVDKVRNGQLSENDKEHIERDLNRTFPDNIRFKPDPSSDPSDVRKPSVDERGEPRIPHDSVIPETSILRALRRVLQSFAVHNPSIGYCQSLNFLAGLLLLFLDEDEEKAFILLNIITNEHLPGTHAKVLEANVDIGVLMTCIRESMPGVWTKINDMQEDPGSGSVTRLPTVSLATTAWFMSCFVGNLPIETVLRVWDSFFYEGSKTLFRIAMAIFKVGELEIRNVRDDMEVFQVVQTIPRKLLDASGLLEACFKRRVPGWGMVGWRCPRRRGVVGWGGRLVELGLRGVRVGRGCEGGGIWSSLILHLTSHASLHLLTFSLHTFTVDTLAFGKHKNPPIYREIHTNGDQVKGIRRSMQYGRKLFGFVSTSVFFHLFFSFLYL
ncbi:hypothetical protein K402DRAFT_159398 [Aulographum hederae CBS 113979]|uniref:Rab-GAP TBC domain-containing protein n=1 Tax=Aulographum hederae CBS 113979 TaxID=1176131 RepID=A0A6G1GRT1_9PEZI|nr:hypothetical protein K402DRAFT_159398 [Aulographum hederae CBS 113979]